LSLSTKTIDSHLANLVREYRLSSKELRYLASTYPRIVTFTQLQVKVVVANGVAAARILTPYPRRNAPSPYSRSSDSTTVRSKASCSDVHRYGTCSPSRKSRVP